MPKRKSLARAARTGAVALAGLAATVGSTALSGCSMMRRASLAAATLREIAAGPDKDAPPVSVAEARFDSRGESVSGLVYVRRDRADQGSPGLVLCHGAAEDGNRDARLVRAATALARAGFAV